MACRPLDWDLSTADEAFIHARRCRRERPARDILSPDDSAIICNFLQVIRRQKAVHAGPAMHAWQR
jgi:hypothetical protein